MWSGFDPQLVRDLENLRQMVQLSHHAPSREWPLHFEDEHDSLLVIREWPNGSLTAYLTDEYSDALRG